MTDIIIIGGGPGGYETALYAAENGLTVTLFEKSHVGGTCLNCGCIPTKTLLHHAEILRNIRNGGEYGFENLSFSFNYAKVVERKDSVISQLRNGIETLLTNPNITVVHGEASFVNENTVLAEGKEYSARNIIIATGSSAKILPIEGAGLEGVVTSTELLNVTEVPKRLCIIGAGVIGMELASCFSTFGSEVTVIEFLKECLPVLDSDIAKRLRKEIDATFNMQSAVSRIERNEDGSLHVVFSKKGKEQSVDADMVLMATGRTPNTASLNLEAAGVCVERGAIKVDDDMRSSVPHIFAIGDVNARCMLAHAATMQGRHSINVLLGKEDAIDLSIMPSAVFTLPEAASVGHSEDSCQQNSIPYTCHKAYYRANGKAVAMGETSGLVKILCEKESGRIIGCHAFGAHAADMIQEVSVMMCSKVTIQQFRDMIHIHPTLGEVLHSI